jgi:cellobiose dehydrogenase (acceptor)
VGGTAVVNLNAQVYGTDNLFVVDASIFPGMVTTNPAALVVVASERASDLILALTPLAPVVRWGQCGGRAYSGSMVCGAPYTCIFQNEYYSQVSHVFPRPFIS